MPSFSFPPDAGGSGGGGVGPALPVQIDAGDAGAVGVSLFASHEDHEHPVNTAVVANIAAVDAAAASAGLSLTIPRGDHKHTVTVGVPVSVNKAPNVGGVSPALARSDHKHDIDTAAPGTIAVGDAATEGVATTIARSDHKHALPAPPAPVNVTKAAAAAGVATTVARSDHKHDISTAVPVTVGTANAEGAATTLARSDHVHDHGAQPLGAGTNHALVTANPGGIAGFMSPADKTKLDGISAAAARQSDYQFGRTVVVPGGGTLQQQGPGNTLAGVRVNRAGTITGGSIQVNVVDAVRAYKLSIRVNGVEVALVALPVGTIGASTAALAVAVVVGDVITAFMVRTAGAGASTFSEQHAMIEVTE